MLVFSIKFFLTFLASTLFAAIVSEVVWDSKSIKMPQWWMVFFALVASCAFVTFFITILIAIWLA